MNRMGLFLYGFLLSGVFMGFAALEYCVLGLVGMLFVSVVVTVLTWCIFISFVRSSSSGNFETKTQLILEFEENRIRAVAIAQTILTAIILFVLGSVLYASKG